MIKLFLKDFLKMFLNKNKKEALTASYENSVYYVVNFS